MRPRVSVIMPTLASRERVSLFRRALASVRAQSGVDVLPIVVLNGPHREEGLLSDLRGQSDVVTVELEAADLPGALRAGRQHVDSPWFSELDDDDILTPGALVARVEALRERPDCGVVVTNGLRRGREGVRLHLDDVSSIEADPLGALTCANWLLPGSWLARTDLVPEDVFEGIPRYLECTYLAARLASTTSIRFLPQSTVEYSTDTPESESKSLRYVLGQEMALRRIIELELPDDVRRSFSKRLAPSCHAAALALAASGDVRGAWRWHARALRLPGGWRLLPRTPRIVHPRLAS